MRKRQANKGLTVNAVAGSYVVVLGLNITDAMRKGLRGFAIKRTDNTDEAMASERTLTNGIGRQLYGRQRRCPRQK